MVEKHADKRDEYAIPAGVAEAMFGFNNPVQQSDVLVHQQQL